MSIIYNVKMRKPIVSGQFYPERKEELRKIVKSFLVSKKKGNIHAVIVPHAGYMFSGKLAGEVFSLIPDKKDFIMLGVNHRGIGNKISFSIEDFETSLGIVKNNKALGEKIMNTFKKQGFDASINEMAHKYEHSLEVQLPFLQLSQKKFEIVPILFSGLNYEECIGIAKVLAEFFHEKECLVVSSDFTHYGANYDFVPFTGNNEQIKEKLFELDEEMILAISKNAGKDFFNLASKSTVCGMLGITIAIEIAKLKKWKARLVDYYTSGDVVNDYENAVGYAGLVFE